MSEQIKTWQERVPEGAYAHEIEAAKDAEIAELRALSRRPAAAPEAPADPMDWPLPCEITVGAGTFAKGVKLRALVARMNVMNDMIREGWSSARADSAAPLPVAEPELLPLPQACDITPVSWSNLYSADQMHAYARAHLSAGQGKDSERLDWLLHFSTRATGVDMGSNHQWEVFGRVIGRGETPRAAIDAAKANGGAQ